MSSSTVYDVKVRYALDDKATKPAGDMARGFDRASKSAMTLQGAMAGIALAGGAMYGVKKVLIDFNSEIDQMKIGMTTILNMQLKKPWDEARGSADKLMVRFQELAKKSPATTKDFMQMANALTPVIASMGGGVDKIEKLTQGTVLAGLATGTRADVAALDVKQMLLGNVTERDMMANQLIAAKGMTKEAFNDLDAAARGSMVESMLQDPALLKAADEFGKSFAGQVSTFQDQLQMALGSVGRPLMQALTTEVQRWNVWIEKHPRTIANIASKLGGMIKNTFQFVGKVVGWLVEHRETLFSIGKIFVAFKGAQIATGLVGGFARGISNFTETIKSSAGKIDKSIAGPTGLVSGFSRLGSIISGAAGLLPGFVGLAMVVHELWSNIDKRPKGFGVGDAYTEALAEIGPATSRYGELKGMVGNKLPPNRFGGYMGIGADMFSGDQDLYNRLSTELDSIQNKLGSPEIWGAALKQMDEIAAKRGDKLNKDLSIEDIRGGYLASADYKTDEEWRVMNLHGQKLDEGTMELIAAVKSFRDVLTEGQRIEAFKYAYPEQFGVPTEKKKEEESKWGAPGAGASPKINVTIHRIEVAADDPDRFVFGMVKALKNVSRNPTQAASAIGD